MRGANDGRPALPRLVSPSTVSFVHGGDLCFLWARDSKTIPANISGTKPPPRQMTSIQALHPFAFGATVMDGLNLAFFLIAAFFGGLTSGLSGFAMGLVVSGVWLHIIAPDQNALLIVWCGLVTQGLWHLAGASRHRLAGGLAVHHRRCARCSCRYRSGHNRRSERPSL